MQEAVSIPPFLVDLAGGVVLRHGREIRLRRKTFALLRYLLEHRDRLLTKDELLENVWHDAHVGDAVLKVTISQLRKTFRESRSLEISTTHGRGYHVRLDEASAAQVAGAADDLLGQHRVLSGRSAELVALEDAFAASEAGSPQLVLVSGEAGIGKSALVEAFLKRLTGERPAAARPWIGRSACLPLARGAEPLHPFLEALAGMQREDGDPFLGSVLARHAPQLVDDAEPGRAEPTWDDRPLPEAVAAEIARLATMRPVVLALEDLQWADARTCEVLALLFARPSSSRLLAIVTSRPPEDAATHQALSTLLHELAIARPPRARVLSLERLSADEVAGMVRNELGEAVPPVARFLSERSGGNPLFADRLLVHLQSCGALQREHGNWFFDEATVRNTGLPRELDGFLAAQVDRLGRDLRRILEAAAVAGTTFLAQDVAAMLGASPEDVESVCDELGCTQRLLEMTGVRSRADGIVGTEYQFRHPLLQNLLYDRLAPARRSDFHVRLARQLEASHGDLAVLHAREIAHHWERGGCPDRNLHWRRVAAHVAVQRGVLADAREHLGEVTRALEDDADGSGRLDAATELARLLVIYSGPNAETAAAVGRALELQGGSGDGRSDAPADEQPTFLLMAMHVVEGNFDKAHETAARLHGQAARSFADGLAAGIATEARVALGLALHGRQRPREAIAELELALREDRPVHGLTVDHAMMAHAVLALSLLQTGRARQARVHYDAALRRARDAEAPINHTIGLAILTELHLLLGEWDWAAHLAEETEAVSVRHDLRSFVGQARFVLGLAEFERGRQREGLERMAESLQACRTTAHGFGVPYLTALHGRALQVAGANGDDALAAVRAGLALAAATGETRFEPEMLRLESAILAGAGAADAARARLEAAIAIASRSGSRLFERRATADLVALLRDRAPAPAGAAGDRALASDLVAGGKELRDSLG